MLCAVNTSLTDDAIVGRDLGQGFPNPVGVRDDEFRVVVKDTRLVDGR